MPPTRRARPVPKQPQPVEEPPPPPAAQSSIPSLAILQGLRLAELSELCQSHHLDHHGRRANLIARLDQARDELPGKPQQARSNESIATLIEQLVPAILARISTP